MPVFSCLQGAWSAALWQHSQRGECNPAAVIVQCSTEPCVPRFYKSTLFCAAQKKRLLFQPRRHQALEQTADSPPHPMDFLHNLCLIPATPCAQNAEITALGNTRGQPGSLLAICSRSCSTGKTWVCFVPPTSHPPALRALLLHP